MQVGVAVPKRPGDLPDRIGLPVKCVAGEDEHPLGAEPLCGLGHSLGSRAAKHHALHSSEDDLTCTHGIRSYMLASRRGRWT